MAKKLPLHRLHATAGATLRATGDQLVPAHYGDAAAELTHLRDACGLVDRSWISRLELTGADRARFLHGLVTCDVKALDVGSGCLGFVTDSNGKVLADAGILALEDRIWIELPPGRGPAIGDHLRKFVVTDDVEILSLADMLPLSVIGPQAAEKLVALLDDGELPAVPWGHGKAVAAGSELHLLAEPLLGASAWTLWVSASIAAAVVGDLLAHGIALVGFEALERLRIEAGIPRFGVDFGPANLPQETGLEDQAVSYEKGCYLGQEIVARLHFRGQASQLMRRLELDGVPTELPAPVQYEGRPAGTVTSAVAVGDQGRGLGLGILHRRAAEAGTAVEVEGDGMGVVRELAPTLDRPTP